MPPTSTEATRGLWKGGVSGAKPHLTGEACAALVRGAAVVGIEP
jgi:hypothetical protein